MMVTIEPVSIIDGTHTPPIYTSITGVGPVSAWNTFSHEWVKSPEPNCSLPVVWLLTTEGIRFPVA